MLSNFKGWVVELCARTRDKKCPKWPLHPTFPYGVKGQRIVKLLIMSDFKGIQGHNIPLEPAIKSIQGDLFVQTFLNMLYYVNFVRFQRLWG